MELEVTLKDNSFSTVKSVLLSYFHISHRLLITLKRMQVIFLNTIPCLDINAKVEKGDTITISLNYDEENENIVANATIALDILYEDDCFLAIHKPAGIPVHPSMSYYENNLASGIRYYFDMIGLQKKIRPVNRLDKDTSGIVLFAKNAYVQECFIKQMQQKKFVKEYIAICYGFFEKEKGTICAPIKRKENSIIERCIAEDGAISITHYQVLEQKIIQNTPISIVKCNLETGRTHQIRVHMTSIGHPLVADTLYTLPNLPAIAYMERQALHSFRITLEHPITYKKIVLEAPLPDDMLKIKNSTF